MRQGIAAAMLVIAAALLAGCGALGGPLALAIGSGFAGTVAGNLTSDRIEGKWQPCGLP